jgi:hypothetical protein
MKKYVYLNIIALDGNPWTWSDTRKDANTQV